MPHTPLAAPLSRGHQQPAQGLVEYALILTLVSLVAIVGLLWLGPAISNAFFIPATASI